VGVLTFTEILSKFGPAKRTGKEYRVRCPVHGDTAPSLDISEGSSTAAIFRCRSAGCQTADILRAVGLAWADVLPAKNGTHAEWDAAHEYRDATGELRYTVFRRGTGPNKVIRQQSASGAWSMAGIARIPYRLPELYGQPRVFVVEGEKCADRLWSIGLPATCNVGGAKKWRDSDSTALKTAGVTSVVVLPDHDIDGFVHAGLVSDALAAVGIAVRVLKLEGLAPKGDIADWLDAGHAGADLESLLTSTVNGHHVPRAVRLVPASNVIMRPVRWLWQDRVALGTMALLAGREGIGKSILAYTLAADVTRGRLPGVHEGAQKSVIVAATEDSWAHTIVPRLVAADADLERIFRVDVHTLDGADVPLSLPIDLPELQRAIVESQTALVLLDPLLSRLDAALDTHKDANVRVALEPLVALGDATGASMLGLIHLNKSASTDMLTLMMGSRAFAAVARSVLFAMEDPDNEGQRLLGQAKNNLGRSDLPTLTFRIGGEKVAETEEGEIWTGKLTWGDDTDRSIRDALQASVGAQLGDSTASNEAADWLLDYMETEGGTCESARVKKYAKQAGHSERTLHRARQKLSMTSKSIGYPRRTVWALPSASIRGHMVTDDATF
jgi:hypothetical protein